MTRIKATKGLARLSITRLFGMMCACACAAEPDTGAHGEATLRPALVSQRVNAVVRRQAQQLVHLDTDYQSFVTTPEHPFATVDSGWVPARDLAAGDQLISAKFGSLRVSSVRVEARAQPVPVFNLTVERSHAYFVGSADVLVHNTKCGNGEDNVTRKTRAIEETKRQLDELKNSADTSSEHQRRIDELEAELKKLNALLTAAKSKAKAKTKPQKPEDNVTRKTRAIEETKRQLDELKNAADTSSEHQKRIGELEAELKKLKRRLTGAKSFAKTKAKAGPKEPQTREDNVTRKTKQIDEARRELASLENTTPTSRKHALQLKNETEALRSEIARLNQALRAAKYEKKRKTQPELINQGQPKVLRGEDLKNELAAAQAELAERERQRTEAGDMAAGPGPRETQLQKLIRDYTDDLKKESERRDLENRLAKLEETARTSNEPRPELELEKQKIKHLIYNIKNAKYVRLHRRRREQEDPEYWAKIREHVRAFWKRARGDSDYVNDPERPRDTIDRLEEELAALAALPSSPSRDWRMKQAKARLDKLKRLTELRLKRLQLNDAMAKARKRRKVLVQKEEDTKAIDDKLAALDAERKDLAERSARERARDILDGLDEEPQGTQRDEDTELFEQEAWDQLLNVFENERADRQDQLEQEGHDVDEEMRLLDELLRRMPSPPRVAEVHSAIDRLRSELNDERALFEDNNFALTNEYAFLNATQGHASTSRGRDAAQRMAEIQAQLGELRVRWQERMQTRLDEIGNRLRDMQASTSFRDETIEAELAQQIALLQHELANPTF